MVEIICFRYFQVGFWVRTSHSGFIPQQKKATGKHECFSSRTRGILKLSHQGSTLSLPNSGNELEGMDPSSQAPSFELESQIICEIWNQRPCDFTNHFQEPPMWIPTPWNIHMDTPNHGGSDFVDDFQMNQPLFIFPGVSSWKIIHYGVVQYPYLYLGYQGVSPVLLTLNSQRLVREPAWPAPIWIKVSDHDLNDCTVRRWNTKPKKHSYN